LIRTALEKAEVLLTMNHGIAHLDNIWGVGGGNRPVKYLTNKVFVTFAVIPCCRPADVMVRALDLRLKRLRVQFPAIPYSGNNFGQVIHTHMPLSPSSIIWHWSRGSDAL